MKIRKDHAITVGVVSILTIGGVICSFFLSIEIIQYITGLCGSTGLVWGIIGRDKTGVFISGILKGITIIGLAVLLMKGTPSGILLFVIGPVFLWLIIHEYRETYKKKAVLQ